MCNNKENAMNKVIDIVVDCCATDLGNGKRHVSIGAPLFICAVSVRMASQNSYLRPNCSSSIPKIRSSSFILFSLIIVKSFFIYTSAMS